MKAPFSSLTVSRVWFVPVLVSRTVAPDTLFPAVSVTVPMTVPYNTCARAAPAMTARLSIIADVNNVIRPQFLEQFPMSFLLAIHRCTANCQFVVVPIIGGSIAAIPFHSSSAQPARLLLGFERQLGGQKAVRLRHCGLSAVENVVDELLAVWERLINDVLNRTETAMTQAHCFLATELALKAQQQARKLG